HHLRLHSFPTRRSSDLSREAGLWHFDRLHLDEIHESGITGEGVTIAVIDDGINTEVPELVGANIEVKGRWCADYDSGEAQPAERDRKSTRLNSSHVSIS